MTNKIKRRADLSDPLRKHTKKAKCTYQMLPKSKWKAGKPTFKIISTLQITLHEGPYNEKELINKLKRHCNNVLPPEEKLK